MIGPVAAAIVLLAVLSIAGALALNRTPLLAPPGPGARLAIYLGEHVAETSENPRLPELRTRAFALEPEALLDAVRSSCADLGWRVTRFDRSALALRCVVRTRWLGFRDDLDARVRARAGAPALLELRSESRVGRGDFGANARHLLVLYDALDRRLDRQ